jgi:transposase
MKLIDFRSLDKKAQAEVRRRAILDYKSMSPKNKSKLAKRYHVTPNVMAKWIANYEKIGSKSFAQDKRGAARYQNTTLNKQQQNWLKKQLLTKTPEDFKLPFSLWTRKLVAQIASEKYGRKISETTIGAYLKSFGMTPQKPILKSYKQLPQRITAWLTQEYPKLVLRAKHEKFLLFWGDETAVRSSDQIGCGYSIRGKKPVQKQAGYRFGINMVSAINNSGNSRFMLFFGKMNSKKFIVFLRKLIKNQCHKIVLIIDNASYHKSALVKGFAAKHTDKLELVFLPPYCPELNPDEYLNNALKQKLNHRPKAKSAKELRKTVRYEMRKMQGSKKTMRKLFGHNSVRYAA